MNPSNFFKQLFNAALRRSKHATRATLIRETAPFLVEQLEPRMMLNGDAGTVVFEAGFEDADVAVANFGFFTSVSGFTATRGAVEVQNNHPAVGPAAEGAKHLELDGNNEIAVDIDTASAAGLRLDLAYSPRAGVSVLENEIEVLWNDEVVTTLSADGSNNRSTDFRSVSIDLPIEGDATTGQLVFRSKFFGSRGVGGLLDNIVVTAQLAPLAIEAIPDQTVGANTLFNFDADVVPPNNDLADINFRLVRAPVGASIDAATGQFRWQASDNNVAATLNRETETTVGTPQVILFADFEDVEVGDRRFDFFDNISGFTATRRGVEVQANHPAVGPASQGSQHIELDGQNGIVRSVDTVEGDLYELTFDFSPRAGADPQTNAVEVLWDGEVIHEVTADGRGNRTTDYSKVTVDLSGFSGDRTLLEFRSKTSGTSPGFGGLIDNVQVTRRAVTTQTSENPFEVLIQTTDSNGRSDSERFNISIDQGDETQAVLPEVEQPPTVVDNFSFSTVVADYRDDYQAGVPAENWQYLWNAPDGFNGTSSFDGSSGRIGDPDNYVPLQAFEEGYTATGTAFPNNAPANFVSLNAFGGHPGAGQLESSSGNTRDRYAIAAWTVDVAGYYAIENSFLTTTSANGQVDVLVHVNDDDSAIKKSVTGNTTENFDARLGFLDEGDVIYVAFGPDDTQSFDSFQHDFSIVQLTGADFSVQVSGGRTSVSESGNTDSFQIVLHQQPTADVLIELTNFDPREISLSAETLTFTADNWDVAQTVTISAIDDAIEDGLQEATITAGIQQANSAVEYREAGDQLISVSIIDNETVATLQAQIDQGLEAGLDQIVLTPGVYETSSSSASTPHLSIVGAEDVSIVADGVTLLATSLSSAVRIQNATNLTLEGLTIDYDPLPFTQGTVVGIASDRSYFDVQIHDGYDLLPDGATTRAIIHSATSRRVKPNTFTRFNSSVNLLQGRTVRISNQQPADALRTGDLVSLTRDVISPHALTIDRSTDVRLEDVTVHASTTFAFYETESSGNEYYNLTVTPGATPVGATEARLLSSNYDGFHSKYAADGPEIVGAKFDSLGDDGIAINGDFALVARNEGDSLIITTKTFDPHIQAGDTLRFNSGDSDAVYERTVEAIERYEEGDIDFEAVSDAHLSQLVLPQGNFESGFRVTLSGSTPANIGDQITNLSRNGSGFEIRDSSISNTRARGLVLKASDGQVTGNTISWASTAGILVSPEAAFFAEADFWRFDART